MMKKKKYPDSTWRFIDKLGHRHEWCLNGEPYFNGDPRWNYTLDSLVRVKNHYECYLPHCRDRVKPKYIFIRPEDLGPLKPQPEKRESHHGLVDNWTPSYLSYPNTK